MSTHKHWTRRELLKCGLAAAAGCASWRGALGMLAGAGASAAEAQLDGSDYRALVCVYLFGANDGYNLLVPRNAGFYTQYATARGNLAVLQDQLLPLNGSDTSGREFGLHPNTPELKSLYDSGALAVVANLGTLLQPTTKADYQAGRNLPPRLFSHNDQQDQSMASEPDAAMRQGWGGRLGERLMSMNTNTALSINISIAGNNIFQTAGSVVPYVIGSGGVTKLTAFNGTTAAFTNRKTAYQGILDGAQGGHLFEAHAGALTSRSMTLADQVDTALASGPAVNAVFPAGNRLGDQLRMVARLIGTRSNLQVKRQVFFVSLGGFDTHDDQLVDHPVLLTQVAQALKAFHDATVELGVAQQLTTFTMSDFGRTLGSNGDGSDHAWGSNALVLGGAVQGGKVYGSFPDLTIDGPDDAGKGRIIPTTSWDQYGATLGRWLGASESDLRLAFPHLDRFASSNLGFLTS